MVLTALVCVLVFVLATSGTILFFLFVVWFGDGVWFRQKRASFLSVCCAFNRCNTHCSFFWVVFDWYEKLSVCDNQCCLSCLLAGCCQNFSIAVFSENVNVIKVTHLHSVTCTPHRALPVHTTFSDLDISRSYQCRALSDSV